MKLKVLPQSLFLPLFQLFCTYFAFINDKKASNIDLAGNVWFGQDANISSKNTRSTKKINSYSAGINLLTVAQKAFFIPGLICPTLE